MVDKIWLRQAVEDIPKLRTGLLYGLQNDPINVVLILAVMEIEAWFLAEYTHFQRINTNLTMERIREALQFDPSIDDAELRDNPTEDLKNIYNLVDFQYSKTRAEIERIVEALDHSRIYLELPKSISDLTTLTQTLDNFFS